MQRYPASLFQSVGGGPEMFGSNPSNPNPPQSNYPATTDYSQYNPYVSANQYQSSFLSGEGAQSLQNIMGTGPATYSQAATQPPYSNFPQPPPPGAPPPPAGQFGIAPGSTSFPPGYNPAQYPANSAPPGPAGSANRPNFPPGQSQFQAGSFNQYPPYQNYQQPTHQQPGFEQPQFQGGGAYSGSAGGPRHNRGNPSSQRPPQPRSSSALTTVRISGRWNCYGYTLISFKIRILNKSWQND